jgi:hypothetical protein
MKCLISNGNEKTYWRKDSNRMPVLAAVPALLIGLGAPAAAYAGDQPPPQSEQPSGLGALTGFLDDNLTIGGFVRTWASMNLQNHPETPGNGAGSFQMLRGSLELDASLTTGPLKWTAVGRIDREILTDYEKQLESLARANTPGGPGSNLLSQYDQEQLREFYVDADVGDRVHLRLGKQQIVWGETDFFHPTDLIQGYDYRWRSFVEPESDEVRKPLIMANAQITVPEVDGTLQLVLRPGLDPRSDIGNSYDLYGGRWGEQPFKGVDFLANAAPYDYNHPYGNANSPTGGARWTGVLGPINYAFSYLNTFTPDPVLNPAANPIGKKPSGALGDFFFPTINVYDASVSGQIPNINTVVSIEIAYQPDRYYNTGTGLPNGTQGAGPVIKKDVVLTTLRMDQELSLESSLGTNQNSVLSVQVFDTWLQNFKPGDDIVAQVGWSAPAKSHDTIVTAFLTLNYMNSRLNPGLAVGEDVSTGDAFVIPSINYTVGNHWRFLAEADVFMPRHARTSTEQLGQSTYALAGFGNNDQLLLRATYQF